jgi:hypothetical protein
VPRYAAAWTSHSTPARRGSRTCPSCHFGASTSLPGAVVSSSRGSQQPVRYARWRPSGDQDSDSRSDVELVDAGNFQARSAPVRRSRTCSSYLSHCGPVRSVYASRAASSVTASASTSPATPSPPLRSCAVNVTPLWSVSWSSERQPFAAADADQ